MSSKQQAAHKVKVTLTFESLAKKIVKILYPKENFYDYKKLGEKIRQLSIDEEKQPPGGNLHIRISQLFFPGLDMGGRIPKDFQIVISTKKHETGQEVNFDSIQARIKRVLEDYKMLFENSSSSSSSDSDSDSSSDSDASPKPRPRPRPPRHDESDSDVSPQVVK